MDHPRPRIRTSTNETSETCNSLKEVQELLSVRDVTRYLGGRECYLLRVVPLDEATLCWEITGCVDPNGLLRSLTAWQPDGVRLPITGGLACINS